MHMDNQASVDRWLEDLEPSRRNYQDHFNNFIAWLREQEGPLKDLTPDGLIAHQKEKKDYEILDLIHAYVRQLKTRTSSKKTIYSVLRSFFAHNRAELPRDPHFKIRSDISPVVGDLRPEQIKKMLDRANTTYRAVFLSIFQGALDLSGFEYWNLKGWPELKEQLDREEKIVKISLPGRKKRRNETTFYTLIGSDAVTWIKNYIDEGSRPRDGTAIFYNKHGDPILKNAVSLYWLRHLNSEKIITRGVGGGVAGRGARYGKNPHELRDTFRSQWAKTHASPEVAEFLMGHDVDPLGYNKAMKDVDMVKEEYKEALPMLQLWSGVAAYGYANRDETQRLRERLASLEAENQALKQDVRQEIQSGQANLKSEFNGRIEDLNRELLKALVKLDKLELEGKDIGVKTIKEVLDKDATLAHTMEEQSLEYQKRILSEEVESVKAGNPPKLANRLERYNP
jgi:hypothetical protein